MNYKKIARLSNNLCLGETFLLKINVYNDLKAKKALNLYVYY